MSSTFASTFFLACFFFGGGAFAFFLDAGSVWDAGSDAKLRLSTGIGFHGDNGFLTVGIPMNATELRVQFMAGVRF